MFFVSEDLIMQAVNALQDAVHPTRTSRQVTALVHALLHLPEVKKPEEK